MAYIGAVAPGYDPTRASVPQLDAERFNGNASSVAFTLTRKVVSPTDMEVFVENVQQEPTTAYTVDGYTLTFTEAPPSGTNNIYVIYRNSGTSNYAYVPDGSITYAKLANNIRQFTVDTFTANGSGSTVVLSETPASANTLVVTVDGVMQSAPTNYTLSGTTVTFTSVPDNGANIVVKHLGFRTTATVQALQAGSVTTTELADGSVTNPKIVSVANTKITGNIISSQIAPSVTLTTPIISGNLGFDSTGTTGVRSPAANTLTFHTSGTEDMRIDSSGNVGIGGTSLGGKLEVIQGTSGSNFRHGSGTYLNISTGAANGTVDIKADATSGAYPALTFYAGGVEQGRFGDTGLFMFNSGYGSVATAYGCRAWAHFNGTAATIFASGGVTSITRTITGVYRVNFSFTMPDANYAPVSSDYSYGSGWDDSLLTTSFKTNRMSGTYGVLADVTQVYVAVFR